MFFRVPYCYLFEGEVDSSEKLWPPDCTALARAPYKARQVKKRSDEFGRKFTSFFRSSQRFSDKKGVRGQRSCEKGT